MFKDKLISTNVQNTMHIKNQMINGLSRNLFTFITADIINRFQFFCDRPVHEAHMHC